MSKSEIGFFAGLGLGLFLMTLVLVVVLRVELSFHHTRAVEKEFAHYDPRTAELTWDNEDVRYVIHGGKQ